MHITLSKKSKGLVELTIELTTDEFHPYLEAAAKALSTQKPIAGFRPGVAPLSVVMRERGAMAVVEEAAEQAVRPCYVKAVTEKQLETVGPPKIEVLRLAPDNPFSFRASVGILPEITLGDYSSLSLGRVHSTVDPASVTKVLEDIRNMKTTETVVNRAAGEHDKVVIDMTMTLDSVAIEGGDAKSHGVYMDEEYYIPGLKEKLLGTSKGKTQTFQLPFPKEHYNKNIAGKMVDFLVTIKDVYERQKPPIDDVLAQGMGQKDVATLRELIEKNLHDEAAMKDAQVFEIELLEKAVGKTRFGDIPEDLIKEETQRMLQELERRIDDQGIPMNDYLQKINKTKESILLDFVPDAIKRIKTSLMLRTIARQESLDASSEEIDAEIKTLWGNSPDEKTKERSSSSETRNYVAMILRNRKAIAHLTSRATIKDSTIEKKTPTK